MSRKRFVHIGFNFEGQTPPITELEKTFNRAIDWLRYDSTGWILYTALPLDTWRDRIRNTPGIAQNVGFLLTEFEDSASYSGYMQNWIWDWLSKDRSVIMQGTLFPQAPTHGQLAPLPSRE